MSEDNRKKHLLRGREGSEQSAEPDKSYSQYNFTCSFFPAYQHLHHGEAGRELKTLLQQHVCVGREFSFVWDPEKNQKPLICVYKTGCAAVRRQDTA